jgi:hypothetical protein
VAVVVCCVVVDVDVVVDGVSGCDGCVDGGV